VHATAAPDGAAGADRVSAVSSARSATSADSAATGSADRRMARQVGASSIQVGISFCRATSAPTRLHRAQAPASRSSTWWTWTKCPAHGCQAYATTTSAAVPVLWVLCRRVLQPGALALRLGLSHPGRGAGQHGGDRHARRGMTLWSNPSVPRGEAQGMAAALPWRRHQEPAQLSRLAPGAGGARARRFRGRDHPWGDGAGAISTADAI